MSLTHNIFVNKNTEKLRSGWQVVVFYTLLIMIVFVVVTLFSLLITKNNLSEKLILITNQTVLLVCTSIASICCYRLFPKAFFVDHLGYRFCNLWYRDLLLGLLQGIGLLLLVIGISYIGGQASIALSNFDPVILGISFIQSLAVFIIGACFEELAFRGFSFQALIETLPFPIVLVVSGCIFSAVHIGNLYASSLSLINTFLAGIWLGIACYKKRNLWMATGLHAGWNFATDWIVGVAVSGSKGFVQSTLLKTNLTGPIWLVGGNYGPEGGFICTIVLTVVILISFPKIQEIKNAK